MKTHYSLSEEVCPKTYISKNEDTYKPSKKKEPTSKLVSLGSAIGTALPMLFFATKQGKFKGDVFEKAVSLFKVDYGKKEILALGASAVAGGFLGGVCTDKGKHSDEKLKEANFQFITNILMPVLFCDFIKEQVEHLKAKHPELKDALGGMIEEGNEKALKTSGNTIRRITAAVAISVAGIVAGVTTGAFISNKLNQLFDPEGQKRKIKVRDLLIQVDDLIAGFTITGALSSVPVLKHIDKVLPLVYYFSGTETGKQK